MSPELASDLVFFSIFDVIILVAIIIKCLILVYLFQTKHILKMMQNIHDLERA